MTVTAPARPERPSRLPPALRLAVALVAAVTVIVVGLAGLFSSAASAQTLRQPETRVGASTTPAGQMVGAHPDIPAGQRRARAPSYDPTAVGSCVAAETGGLPELTIDDAQFGQKVGQHAEDFGLDPADPEARALIRKYIEDIRSNPDEVRQGPWNPKGGGGSDYLFFRQGGDVVVAKGDGMFVTILQGGQSNGWFQGATPR